jgi:hypothetical protein
LSETVVSCCNSAEVLEASEHALDGVAVTIEDGREAVFPSPIDLGRNVGRRAPAFDLATDGVAVVALVTVQNIGRGHVVEQNVGGDAICHLAAGQEEREWTAEMVRERMDFRGAPATRTADRLIDLPPFPPEALR